MGRQRRTQKCCLALGRGSAGDVALPIWTAPYLSSASCLPLTLSDRTYEPGTNYERERQRQREMERQMERETERNDRGGCEDILWVHVYEFVICWLLSHGVTNIIVWVTL